MCLKQIPTGTKEKDVLEEYRDRLLEKEVDVLLLEIYQTFAGTDFIDNTLDLVQILETKDNTNILQELKEIRENIAKKVSTKYSPPTRTAYIYIIEGYILRLKIEMGVN